MQTQLAAHYREQDDDTLRELAGKSLTDTARAALAAELARRGIAPPAAAQSDADAVAEPAPLPEPGEPVPAAPWEMAIAWAALALTSVGFAAALWVLVNIVSNSAFGSWRDVMFNSAGLWARVAVLPPLSLAAAILLVKMRLWAMPLWALHAFLALATTLPALLALPWYAHAGWLAELALVAFCVHLYRADKLA